MKLLRRVCCFSLAALLFISCPIMSYAASSAVPAAAPTVAEYIFDTLLAANGIEAPLSSVSSWLGSWTGYDDYLQQGSRGELGAFSQYLYDIEHSEMAEDAKASARQQRETVASWMSMDWADVAGKEVDIGSVLDGWTNGGYSDAALVNSSVRGFLKTFTSYGTGALDYVKRPVTHEYSVADWVKPDSFGSHIMSYSQPGLLSTYTGFRDYYYTSEFSSSPYAHKPFGVLSTFNTNYNQWNIQFKYISANPGSIGKVYALTLMVHVVEYDNSTGTVEINRNSDVTASGTRLPVSAIKQLPFPVFANQAAADAYVQSTVMDGIYNQLAQGLPVASVNQEAQATDIKVVPTVITLPGTAEQARELLERLEDAIDRIDELEVALKNAGLAIDWGIEVVKPTESETATDISGEGEAEGKVTLADVIAKVEAIPAAVAAFFDKKLEPDDIEQDVDDMKLPVSLADKFPFCIPFDIAYLVKSLSAASEVPRFELPFKVHYLGFNFEETFIVDMSDWDVAVKILRTMLDLLFIAGLVSVTRDLIRG